MVSKNKKFTPIYVFLILISSSIYIITGCEPSRHASQQSEVSSVIETPHDLRIVCGQGGGFTGAWNGYTILGEGNIQSWKGAYAEDQFVADTTMAAESIALLWQDLERMDFFSMEKEEYANMTAMVLVEANNQSHRVSWPPKVEGFESLETPLDSFYVKCLSISKAAMGR